MANSWLKLYHETLNDPKMGTMTDHLYRRTIELFLLAGQENRDGLLPPLPQIAWALRTTVNDVTLCLQELSELGIISKLPDGSWMVTHFADRQNSNLSGAERVAKLREKRAESYTCNADDVTPVTQMLTQDVTETKRAESYESPKNVTVDKDKDKDKEEDKDKEKDLINKAAEAAARGRSSKSRYTPDQPEFWQRAFGPEADRAKAFSTASGIVPIGTEFGRWQKDLRDFSEAGISISQMTRAVEKVRKEGRYPIKAPGTVLTVARNLAAAPAAAKTNADYLEELEWEGCNE